MAIRIRGRPGFTSIFFPGADGDDGRVKIPLVGNPVNVGSTDFTVDSWWRPSSTGNDRPAITPGNNGDGVNSNIGIDRDRYDQAPGFGIGLSGGRVTTWLDVTGGGTTVISTLATTDIRDDAWHHVRYSRVFSNGRILVWVDGTLETDTGTGPTGDVTYTDPPAPIANPNGIDSDRFLVIGAEKHGFTDYSLRGWMDEIAWFTSILTTASSFTPPGPWVGDEADLVALYRFDEPGGTSIVDALGASPGTFIPTAGAARSTRSPFS